MNALGRVSVATIVSAWLAAGIQAQEAQPAPEFQGPASCIQCHTPTPVGIYPRDFVALDESMRFLTSAERERLNIAATDLDLLDKHAQAFATLESDLGRQILQRLNIDDVRQAKQCLSCHANWKNNQDTEPPPFFERGVTCESCHGPSSAWVDPHWKPEWRTRTADQKRQLGMVEVRNPEQRAAQCFSCHIGDAEQNKVVTHQMYAAGHPPLPGMELETFAAKMPPHWRYLQEKGNFQFRDEFIAANYDAAVDTAKDLPRTRSVLTGAVAAQRQMLQLFVSQYAHGERVDEFPLWPRWPEFAVFDCGACHHDLQATNLDLTLTSWRQKRGYAGAAPGRPALPNGPEAVIHACVHAVHGGDATATEQGLQEYRELMDEVQAAVAARPFGDGAATAQAVGDVVAWLNELLQRLAVTTIDAQAADRALQTLYAWDAGGYPDFHSARQVAWAVGMIEAERRAAPYPARDQFPDASVDVNQRQSRDYEVLAQWIDSQWKPSRTTVQQHQASSQLAALLLLQQDAGQSYDAEQAMAQLMETMAGYDPGRFQEALRVLRESLQE